VGTSPLLPDHFSKTSGAKKFGGVFNNFRRTFQQLEEDFLTIARALCGNSSEEFCWNSSEEFCGNSSFAFEALHGNSSFSSGALFNSFLRSFQQLLEEFSTTSGALCGNSSFASITLFNNFQRSFQKFME
jgi:hypothetical protein